MRIAPYLSMLVVSTLMLAGRASGDPSSNANDPNLLLDPDGIPLSVTHPQDRPATQDEIEADLKRQQQAALQKDWLLRDYEKLRRDRGNAPGDQDANLYYQLGSNRELARLAGLPAPGSDDQQADAASRAGATLPGQNSTTSRPGATSPTAGYSLAPSNPFRPLISPLSSPGMVGMHSFYSSTSTPLFSVPGLAQRPGVRSTAPQEESSDLDSPGLVAAEKSQAPNSDDDLSLDLLPGETMEQAKARQDNAGLELSVPMTTDQLHKEEADALSVPTASGATTNAAPSVVIPVAPIADPEAPMPASKTLPINPVRAPIANPFDILNR
jgi:hypothetical protein